MRLDQSRCDEDQKKRLSRLSGEREQLRVIRVLTCATFLANKCSLTTTSALISPHFALAFTGIIIIAAVCARIFSLEERRGKKLLHVKEINELFFAMRDMILRNPPKTIVYRDCRSDYKTR